MDLLGIGASLLGGLFGSKNKGTTETAKREPWSAVQPWLQNNIAQGQELQSQYMANPFNPLQQKAYENTFADLDNYRNNVAPGLLNWASQAMQNGYQRPNATTPGTVGYGGQAAPQQSAQQQGPFNMFSVPQQSGYSGLLNFAPPQRPAAQQQQSTMPTDAQAFDKAMQEYQRRELERQMYTPSQNWYSGFGA